MYCIITLSDNNLNNYNCCKKVNLFCFIPPVVREDIVLCWNMSPTFGRLKLSKAMRQCAYRKLRSTAETFLENVKAFTLYLTPPSHAGKVELLIPND